MNCRLVYTAVCQQQDARHGVHQALCIMRTHLFFGVSCRCVWHWTFSPIYQWV